MKCQNNVAMAALVGVAVGVLLGAGTAQYAQVMAFYGVPPNYAKSAQDTFRPNQDAILRERSDMGTYEAPSRNPTREQAQEAERLLRSAAYGSAVSSADEPTGCDRYGIYTKRWANCVVNERDFDTEWQPWETRQ